jgi:ribose transport system ATP-binding protein
MKILGGITSPTAGTIEIDGERHNGLTVRQSIAAGIAFVHQELNTFDNLDVAANILLGREIRKGRLGLLDRKAMARAVEPVLARIGANFGPDDPVAKLSIAELQLLEIARALSMNARLVIMDEPTSSLTLSETNRLMGVIAELKNNGIAVLFISHRLGEVEQCADRVEVLRDGRNAGELSKDDIDHDRMIRLMIGRNFENMRRHETAVAGEPVLEVRDVRTAANPGATASLVVRAGEIVGLAGLVGAGRTELANVIFGVDRKLGGQILLNGIVLENHDPADAIQAGLCLVPEDRKETGLILDFPISHNISLPRLRQISVNGLVQEKQEIEIAEKQRSDMDIRVSNVRSVAAELSGGNQQKVVLGKWLSMKPRMVIFDEPTRGIDVGAKAEIYRIMRELVADGVAILKISSDMEEVLGISDRIAVMHHGKIAGVLNRDDFSEHNVLTLAVG